MRRIESKTRTLKSLGDFVIPATDRNIPVEIEDYNNIGELFEYAKRDGYSKAKYELGKLYYQGDLVSQNINLAYYWLKEAYSEDYDEAKPLLLELNDINHTDNSSEKYLNDKHINVTSDSNDNIVINSINEGLWVKLIRYGLYLLFVSVVVTGFYNLYIHASYNDYHYSFEKNYKSQKGSEKECYYTKGFYSGRKYYSSIDCGDYYGEKEILIDIIKNYEFSFNKILLTDDILNHYTDNELVVIVKEYFDNNEIKYKTELKVDFEKLMIGSAFIIGALIVLFFLLKLIYRYLILSILWLIKKIQEDDTPLYVEADKEIQSNNVEPGLWSKALVKANGNENKQKALYIKMRVKQLKNTP